MKKIILAALVAVIGFEFSVFSQTNPIPPALQVPGAPTFNPAGLSFTNVTWRAATGTKVGASGGTLSYLQADGDLSKVLGFNLPLDIGLSVDGSPSTTGNGFHDLGASLELEKNLSNWQLAGKLGYSRQFETDGVSPTGNYFHAGFDVNYNLAAGSGLSFLSTSGGSFTYVGAGIDWEAKDLNVTSSKPSVIERTVRIYVGVAF